jgi:ubiquitin-like 1-activating enzyme E1 A
MVEQSNTQITEQEAELYDRQIRLWGLDAQKRLRSSRVCVVGMGGLGCEVSKNLVLSGVKSLNMVDGNNLSAEDATSQFLAPRDKVGSNRAEASLLRLQQLNPMVEVTADPTDSTVKDAEFFQKFEVVVATTCSQAELVRINSICRAAKILFYAGDVFGFFGFSFMDLVSHNFVEEVTQQVQQEDDTDEPQTKKQKTAETETKSVKKEMAFVSLAETLKVDWSSELYSKRIRRMDPSFFLLQVLFAFKTEMGHNPRPGSREEDLAKLTKLRDTTLTKLSVPTAKIPDQMLGLLFAELSPVAAIVGGVLGQEIIKAISNKDAPHNNFFFYNPVESCGVVETIGY